MLAATGPTNLLVAAAYIVNKVVGDVTHRLLSEGVLAAVAAHKLLIQVLVVHPAGQVEQYMKQKPAQLHRA